MSIGLDNKHYCFSLIRISIVVKSIDYPLPSFTVMHRNNKIIPVSTIPKANVMGILACTKSFGRNCGYWVFCISCCAFVQATA